MAQPLSSQPRVQLVTRRFWPLSGDSAWRWLAVATAMRSAGWQVEVITALWHSAWPERVELREFAVHRAFVSPTTPFRMRRAMRQLLDYTMASHKQAAAANRPINLVMVDAADDEASALLDYAKELPPVVVRYESIDLSGGRMAELVWRPAIVALPLLERLDFSFRETSHMSCASFILERAKRRRGREGIVASSVDGLAVAVGVVLEARLFAGLLLSIRTRPIAARQRRYSCLTLNFEEYCHRFRW